MISTNNAAIVCTLGELFEHYDRDSFAIKCEKYVSVNCGMQVNESNRDSWKDCYDFLKRELGSCEWARNIYAAFEFKMPESQKRADVILLTKEKVVILEFKRKEKACLKDALQVGEYRQSISCFHFATGNNNMEVKPYLTLTKAANVCKSDSVDILDRTNFASELAKVFRTDPPMTEEDAEEWLRSSFYPSDDLSASTKNLFKTGKLPHIKSVKDGEIQDCLDAVNSIINDSHAQKRLVFVTGVPGSGKTLVGLKTVYDQSELSNKDNAMHHPVYITGNGPLVDILQNSLSAREDGQDGKSYILPLSSFKKDSDQPPVHDIVVFDEAQRAWDDPNFCKTEPNLLLAKCDSTFEKYKQGVTLICIIGEGQAISKNEEKGMALWIDALRNRPDWIVYSSSRLKHSLSDLTNYIVNEDLTLHTSIRTDFLNTAPWVESILDGNIEKARNCYRRLVRSGFKVHVFNNARKLDAIMAKHSTPDEHTGFIISSHNTNAAGRRLFGEKYHLQYVKTCHPYQWFMRDSHDFCNTGTEFLVQGIDLDWPVVGFLGDYYLENGKWKINPHASHFNSEIINREQLIENVYRVLLTRARKGLYLFVPKDPILKETYETLRDITRSDLES